MSRLAMVLPALVLLASCSGSTDSSTTPTVAQTATVADSTAATTEAPSTAESPGSVPTSASPSQSAEPGPTPAADLEIVAFPVPEGSRPHDVAPAADGGVWYTAQGSGELGWLDPETGETHHIALGQGSSPHGVIVGDDGAAWVTDSGLNAIVRVDPLTEQVDVFALPEGRSDANLNTAAFDAAGRLWFTGQNGIYGVFDSTTEGMEVFDAPRGRGPYGIAATPDGTVYYASLAGSYVGRIADDGGVTVIDPPTPDQGARRVWADSSGSIWVSEWNSGQLSRYDPAADEWTSWPLPGTAPRTYAVYVDEADAVWLSDFGGNAIHRFDPTIETFITFDLPSDPGDVRQILGRPGEVWGAESAADQLVVIRRR